MEYLENSYVKDLTISNLINIGALGSIKCGEYQDGKDGGMPLQDRLTNQGYGGTSTRAMNLYGVTGTTLENVQVQNIISFNGPSHGMYLYDSCNVDVKQGTFKHITGGIVNEEDYSSNHWPNPAAEGCAVSLFDANVINVEDVESVCIHGHTNCIRCATEDSHSCTGVVSDCQEDVSYSTPSGKISITSNGNVVMESTSTVPYIPIMINPLFDNSKTVSLHRQQYIKKTNKWYHNVLSKFNFKIENALLFMAIVMIVFTIIAYYLAKERQNKYIEERRNNTQKYIIKNDSKNIISNMILYIHNWIMNKSKNYGYKNEEYSNIDDVSSLHYQETEFLVSK